MFELSMAVHETSAENSSVLVLDFDFDAIYLLFDRN